jgi:hypothetical protein
LREILTRRFGDPATRQQPHDHEAHPQSQSSGGPSQPTEGLRWASTTRSTSGKGARQTGQKPPPAPSGKPSTEDEK